MQRLLALAALLAAAAAAQELISIDGPIFSSPSLSATAFVLSETFDFASGATSQPPVCTGDSSCVALLMVNPSTGTDVQSYDNAGAQMSGMTPGSGNTFQNSIWHTADGGWLQEVWVDDTGSSAAVPRIDNPAVRAAFAGDHTVVCAGYWTSTGTWWAQIQDGTRDFQLRTSGSVVECLDGSSETTQLTGNCGSSGRCVVSCRRAGNVITVRAQGAQATGTGGIDGGFTGSAVFGLGGTKSPNTTPAGTTAGKVWCAIYNTAKSDAWMTQTEKNAWGAPNVQSGGNGAVGTSLASLIGRDDLAWPGGGVAMFAPGAYISDPVLGLRHQAGFQNFWATDPLAAATWTDVGTPTVTSNASAGPFYAWKHTNECDLIVDDDAAAFEGKRSATVTGLDGGPGGWFNASCYLKAGTSGTTTSKARISFTHNGVMDAGSATCDVTGLSSTAARYPLVNGCYAWIDGATSVQANLLVGNATSDTGSVTSCQCQLTQTMFMEAPTVDNTAKGANWPELDGGGIPFGLVKGKLQAVFTATSTSTLAAPRYTDHGGASGGIAQYVIDAYNNAASHDVLLSLTTISYDAGLGDPGIQALMYGASSSYENRFDVPAPFGPLVDAGQPYVFSYEWRTASGMLPDAGSGVGCRGVTKFDVWTGGNSASTVIAQNSGAADTRLPLGSNGQNSGALGTCPANTNVVDLGTRIQGTSPTSGWVRKLEIYR